MQSHPHIISASDIAKEKKRSKITPEDVFTALQELGFESYQQELREFMRNYNSEKEDRNIAANKKRVADTNEPSGSLKRMVNNNSDNDDDA